ncbi:MAG: TM2 domain-containing protein, partial [Ktedonobacterales bacterium]
MSVDISQLAARLDPERREAIKTQYEERETNPTAAFLLCFFLGSAGAHRFYLKEWRVGFAHLALFVVGVAALIWGLTQTLPLTSQLASHPAGAALDTLGVLLLLAALIWEIVDLGRIDHEVYHRNLLLAEGIIAGNMLADQTGVDAALRRAEAATHPEASGAGAEGVITTNQVADARALAEETGGLSSISYSEVSRYDASADPDSARQAAANAQHGAWSETTTTSGVAPAATPDAAPMPYTETTTHTHFEEGPRVSDSYLVDREPGPSAAEVADLGAAGLGAAALGAGALGAAHASGFDEPTQPDLNPVVTPEAMPEATPVVDDYATAPAGAYPTSQGGAYSFGEDDMG